MKPFAIQLLAVVLFYFTSATHGAPLALHPKNPHYFTFNGQPTILITSGEHYGAVVNLDFDYRPYFEALAANSLNSTRVFSGVYFEPEGAFNIAKNTLAPRGDRFISPWLRTDIPANAAVGRRFDLTKWNPDYFARLRDFMSEAARRGVIVEYVLFCPFYEEPQWALSPLNQTNNVNRVGDVARTNVYTLDKHGGLLAHQEALVRKVVTELNAFDNLYYEVCNEPYFGGVTVEWQHRIVDVVTETERSMPKKHLISMNIANGSKKIEKPHPDVSIFNFHYANPPDAVAANYGLNRVIGDNETGFRGTNNLVYRSEAWNFILAGGALFNHLDYSFTADNESGDFVYPATQPGGGNAQFRNELKVLRNFISTLDFISMKPAHELFQGKLPKDKSIYVLAKPREQYAAYIGPRHTSKESSAIASSGGAREETVIAFDLPKGSFETEWISPLTGEVLSRSAFMHDGGRRVIDGDPDSAEDIALRILKR